MKILLADSSEVWCDALEDQLKSNYDVIRCADGREVLPLLSEHGPELLVLGLDLPYMDGLTILQLIHSSGLQTRILVASTHMNEYISGMLAQFKISHALIKPCTVCAAMTQIHQMLHYDTGVVNEPDSVLLALGLRMNLSGYNCVRTAVALLRENPEQQLTKSLYPEVAKRCGGTRASVERVMRTVIHDAWMRRDNRVWQAYFTPDRAGRIACPSLGVFITRIALGRKDNRACG